MYAVAADEARGVVVAGTKSGSARGGAMLAFIGAWRTASGDLLWEHTLVGRGVSSLLIAPSGDAVVGCDDGTVVVLRGGSGRSAASLVDRPSHGAAVVTLRMLDSDRLLSVGADGSDAGTRTLQDPPQGI